MGVCQTEQFKEQAWATHDRHAHHALIDRQRALGELLHTAHKGRDVWVCGEEARSKKRREQFEISKFKHIETHTRAHIHTHTHTHTHTQHSTHTTHHTPRTTHHTAYTHTHTHTHTHTGDVGKDLVAKVHVLKRRRAQV